MFGLNHIIDMKQIKKKKKKRNNDFQKDFFKVDEELWKTMENVRKRRNI